jgi:hypothetical protein
MAVWEPQSPLWQVATMAERSISWSAIRPWDNSCNRAFEELTAQLARAESPPESEFVRKGTPDAGVECYTVHADGTEWAWQAKYFLTSPGNPQWQQVNESFQSAFEKHPRMVRYYVVIPIDLADGRISKRKSAYQRWRELVDGWKKRALQENRELQVIWWGSSELLERLGRPQHVGRVRFWFNKLGFTSDWFRNHVDEAIATAGPRYSAEIHVDLPVAQSFEAFGRTHRFFNEMAALANPLRDALKDLEYATGRIIDVETPLDLQAIFESANAALALIGSVNHMPIDQDPFSRVLASLNELGTLVARKGRSILHSYKQTYDRIEPREVDDNSRLPRNPQTSEVRNSMAKLEHVARTTMVAFQDAERIAGRSSLVVVGRAGVGKTHLLCDIVSSRIAKGQPSVLLMGQRFKGQDEPWTHILRQLDLANSSAEEFLGAFDACAQASNQRALLVIDAINEGAGRMIWRNSMAAFVRKLAQYPWLALVLSVRRPYEQQLIPEEVAGQMEQIVHEGFGSETYIAMRTFFAHYGLEIPSSPVLVPEFNNPLFLKILCQGLQQQRQRRLPRGHTGVVRLFRRYLENANVRLADQCDYDPRVPYVEHALKALGVAILDCGQAWLPRQDAAKIVDELLPNRRFEQSLFHGLLTENLLLETIIPVASGEHEDFVSLAYERLSDHVIANEIYRRTTVPGEMKREFAEGALLNSFPSADGISVGVLSALCIVVAEESGSELFDILPHLVEHWGAKEAFRQSLIWRDAGAYSEATFEKLAEFCQGEDELRETLNVVLTLAIIPHHPLNAEFLHENLVKRSMPGRDAWWSTFLFQAWDQEGPVRRLVDWAGDVSPEPAVCDDVLELCGIALGWMLTTSNRLLRDHATKGLVNLYSDRLNAMAKMVERFAHIDDPYVVERIYGVAYGVAMRSAAPAGVEHLASTVYKNVFAEGSPGPHVLMRDYARGVVERSIHLGGCQSLDPKLIRPPYRSAWPTIRSGDDLKELMPDWTKGSHASGEGEWGRNIIGTSIFDGDFLRYVIEPALGPWLALQLDEPKWTPPPDFEVMLDALVADFSSVELEAWTEFKAAVRGSEVALPAAVYRWFVKAETDSATHRILVELGIMHSYGHIGYADTSSDWTEKRSVVGHALGRLAASLSRGHARALNELWTGHESWFERSRPPRFDVDKAQRYILQRVFELGWTTERFGTFDRFVVPQAWRDAQKPERIGKKYQWIALLEFIGYLGDHFQYRREYDDDRDEPESGVWHLRSRDIDPSLLLRLSAKGRPQEGSAHAWWDRVSYAAWDSTNPVAWVECFSDLPQVEELLVCHSPPNGERWLNGNSFFKWEQSSPPDRHPRDLDVAELWYIANCYMVRLTDISAFMSWAEAVDFGGRWMPAPSATYEAFLGEHGWHPAGTEGLAWTRPGRNCPIELCQVAAQYNWEAGGLDCSLDESVGLRLPSAELVRKLGLHWNGRGAEFVTSKGQVVAQDPTAARMGPEVLLLRADSIDDMRRRDEITLCWAIIGEKRIRSAGSRSRSYPVLRMSGAYVLDGASPRGFMKCFLEDHDLGVSRLVHTHWTNR